jgi:hypothetical protein
MRGIGLTLAVAVGLVVAACSGTDNESLHGDDAGGKAAGDCKSACAAPQQCCKVGNAGFCINTTIDDGNCGACGHACDPTVATTCVRGQCMCGDSTPACSAGSSCCIAMDGSGTCANLKNDPANCGACGNACDTGSICENGRCVCPATDAACAAGTTCCQSGCADLQNSKPDCGMCGQSCRADDDSKCVQGGCVCVNVTGNYHCGQGWLILLPKCCKDHCIAETDTCM